MIERCMTAIPMELDSESRSLTVNGLSDSTEWIRHTRIGQQAHRRITSGPPRIDRETACHEHGRASPGPLFVVGEASAGRETTFFHLYLMRRLHDSVAEGQVAELERAEKEAEL
jgi:hypothetical protein